MAEQAIQVRFAAVDTQLLTATVFVQRVQHARFQRLAYAPKNMVGNFVYTLPEHRVIAIAPLLTEVAIEYFGPLPGEERRHVHAVGDVGQGIFFRLNLRP